MFDRKLISFAVLAFVGAFLVKLWPFGFKDKRNQGLIVDYYNISSTNLPYRFNSFNQNAQKYFYLNGFVVIGNVLNKNDIKLSENFLWNNYLNQKSLNWLKYKPETWHKFPGMPFTGIVFEYGISHSLLQWYIRTRINIINVFCKIWNITNSNSCSKQLITSFDGIGIYRPWKYKNNKYDWDTVDSWYHTDQNIITNKNFEGAQSSITLYNQTYQTGSIVVIPKSHTLDYNKYGLSEFIKTTPNGNYAKFNDDIIEKIISLDNVDKPLLVTTFEGDMIVWDSRLIHCNFPSLEILESENNITNIEQRDIAIKPTNWDLLRVVSYVSMMPRHSASNNILQQRQNAFEVGMGTNHLANGNYFRREKDNKTFNQLLEYLKNNTNYHLSLNISIETVRNLVGY